MNDLDDSEANEAKIAPQPQEDGSTEMQFMGSGLTPTELESAEHFNNKNRRQTQGASYFQEQIS